MSITELIDSVDPMLTDKPDIGAIRLRLTKVRLAGKALEDQVAELRAAREKLETAHHEKVTELNKIVSELVQLQRKFQGPAKEPKAKKTKPKPDDDNPFRKFTKN